MSIRMMLTLALTLPAAALAQDLKATTEDGRSVILHRDGTWDFEKASSLSATAYRRPAKADKKISGKHESYAVWYDSSIWSVAPAASNSDAEYEFSHRDGDAYAMVIHERIEMDINTLRDIALSNARGAAPDAQITLEETRKIGDTDLLCLQIEGTIQTIKFKYYGYYYAGPAGTLQFLTYTGRNLFPEYEPDLVNLLNGLEILK